MVPVKTCLQFEKGTDAAAIWKFVDTLKAADLIAVPVVVAKYQYAACVVHKEDAVLPLLRAAARAKLRIEFRYD